MMRARVLLLAAWLATYAVFRFGPALDVAISRLFIGADGGFIGATLPPVQWLYLAAPWVGRLWVVGALVLLLIGWGWRGSVGPRWRRRCTMLLLCAALASGLVIETALKNHSGRPRPHQIVEFGGTQPFVPAFVASTACARNCSFSSGHAAVGFMLAAWGALGTRAVRRRWNGAAIAAGGVIGIGRIAQGAHFASDVLVSGLVVWTCCALIRAIWVRLRAQRLLARRAPGMEPLRTA